MAENVRPCRCLLFEAGQADMARTVAEFVSGLDEAIRTMNPMLREGDVIMYENDLPDHYSEV